MFCPPGGSQAAESALPSNPPYPCADNVEDVAVTDKGSEFQKWMNVAAEVGAAFDQYAEESEAGGTVAAPAVAALKDSGLLGAAVPKTLGGAGLSATEVMDIIEELSRADASAGWCAMINIATAGVCSSFLPDEGARTVFAGAEPPVMAQNRTPFGGTARRVDGGYEIRGKFGFGSGSAYSNWLGAGAFVVDDNNEQTGQAISFVVPASQCKLDTDWNVIGLKATASVDFEVLPQLVPDHMTWPSPKPIALRGSGIYRAAANQQGGMVVAAAGHTPVVIGMAFRSLQEIARVAARRKRLVSAGGGVIADEPVFLDGLSRREAALRAARAYLYDVAEAIDSSTVDWTTPAGTELCARMRHAAIHAHDVAEEVIRFSCTWAGTAALRMPNILGRSTMDITAARCHILVDPAAMTEVGRLLVKSLPDAKGAFDFGQLA
jgi:alkylation response protein AidB-like acyl-CoA dehydrogenase